MLRETSHPEERFCGIPRRGGAQLTDAALRTVAFKGQEASGTRADWVPGTCVTPILHHQLSHMYNLVRTVQPLLSVLPTRLKGALVLETLK